VGLVTQIRPDVAVSMRRTEPGVVGAVPAVDAQGTNEHPEALSKKYSHFLATALAADLVTFEPASFFVTLLMMPTATVWRMSRTAKRPSGG
jgi:hypothetical protein